MLPPPPQPCCSGHTSGVHCPPASGLSFSVPRNSPFPFLPLLPGPESQTPSEPQNATAGRTHGQHQLLEVPGQLPSDAGFDGLPRGLQILIKHWVRQRVGDVKNAPTPLRTIRDIRRGGRSARNGSVNVKVGLVLWEVAGRSRTSPATVSSRCVWCDGLCTPRAPIGRKTGV